jgi:uncharacterized protein DUF4404
MSKSSLEQALVRLHAELQGSPQLDAESRRLLDTITADIRRARGDAGTGGAGDHAGGVSGDAAHASRLEELAVRWETEHPELAARLRGIADALGRVGL